MRDADAQKKSLGVLALETESRDQARPVAEIRDALNRALVVMRRAVNDGMTGDLQSASGLVGGAAAKLRGGPPGPFSGTPFRDVLARALAVQEVNAAMGVIVAAPTAGGAGILPAVLTGLAAIEMALAGITFAIPADEVIDVMGEIGREMDVRYRETAGGGLAATPTGRRLARERMVQIKRSGA